MEQTAKQPWQKPELIVLVRSKPEEAVLLSCKAIDSGGVGSPAKNQVGCDYHGALCPACYEDGET